jgi:hypothetical protein
MQFWHFNASRAVRNDVISTKICQSLRTLEANVFASFDKKQLENKKIISKKAKFGGSGAGRLLTPFPSSMALKICGLFSPE